MTENETLRAALKNIMECDFVNLLPSDVWDEARAALAATAAPAEPSADAKDAGRYRYLRATTKAVRSDDGLERTECTPDTFDSAIDRAIARRIAIKP